MSDNKKNETSTTLGTENKTLFITRTNNKMNFAQAVQTICDKFDARINDFIIETDFGKFAIRKDRDALCAMPDPVDVTEWNKAYIDDFVKNHVRDSSIQYQIRIGRNHSRNIQEVMVALGLAKVFARNCLNVGFVTEELEFGIVGLWLTTYKGFCSKELSDARYMASAYVRGIPKMSGRASLLGGYNAVAVNFAAEYFRTVATKFRKISDSADKIEEEINKGMIKSRIPTWPLGDQFHKKALCMMVSSGRLTVNNVCDRLEKVYEHPYDSAAATIQAIFSFKE